MERFLRPNPMPDPRPETLAVIVERTHNTILKGPVYKARVYFGDVRTSLYCGHRHATPQIADRCASKLYADTMATIRNMECLIEVTAFGDTERMFDIVTSIDPDPEGRHNTYEGTRFYVMPQYVEGGEE